MKAIEIIANGKYLVMDRIKDSPKLSLKADCQENEFELERLNVNDSFTHMQTNWDYGHMSFELRFSVRENYWIWNCTNGKPEMDEPKWPAESAMRMLSIVSNFDGIMWDFSIKVQVTTGSANDGNGKHLLWHQNFFL